MMTDYSKWSSFDHDAALDEVDTRATVEAATEAQKKLFHENAKRSEDNLVNAKMQVEILQSKVNETRHLFSFYIMCYISSLVSCTMYAIFLVAADLNCAKILINRHASVLIHGVLL